ncbi:Protein angel 2 [Mortierella alpina]|nr:Protein angel 2 [Mortierella alpina]
MYLSHFEAPPAPSPSLPPTAADAAAAIPGAAAPPPGTLAMSPATLSSASSPSAGLSVPASAASTGPVPNVSSAAAPAASSAALTPAQRERQEAYDRLRVLLESTYQPRQWEVLDPGRQATVSVVTYNLLSRSLASVDAKFTGVVRQTDPRGWTARCTLLLNEIAALNADIVCVQEVDEPDYEGDIGTTMIRLGYAGVFQKRRHDLQHGMAIFYRKSRITLVRECHVPCPDSRVVKGVEHAGVMLVLELDDGRLKRRVCVATTHLLNGNLNDLRRLGQMVALMSAIEIQLRRDPAMPFLLTGDFNSVLGSPICQYVERGRLWPDQSITDDALERFKAEMWSVRELVEPSAFATKAEELRALVRASWNDVASRDVSHSLHTASVYRVRGIVDHIFHGQIGGSPVLEVVSRLELPESLARLKAGLPAAHLGSDHFALAARFCFSDEADEVDEVLHELVEEEEEEEE